MADLSKKRTPPRKKEAQQSNSFFAKVGRFFKKIGKGIAKFCKDLKGEMGKISWYSRRATINNSILVIITIAVVTAVVGLMDWGISQGILALASNL